VPGRVLRACSRSRYSQVDRDVADQHHADRHEQRALDHRDVVLLPGLQGQLGHPGQVEDLLGHDRAADQVRDLQAEHGQRRSGRVAQHVPQQHPPGGQAAGGRTGT
jgi:hypothetical protein